MSLLESKTLVMQVVLRNRIQKVSKAGHEFFPEESWFKLNGKVKMYIDRYWLYKYPHTFFQSPLQDFEPGV